LDYIGCIVIHVNEQISPKVKFHNTDGYFCKKNFIRFYVQRLVVVWSDHFVRVNYCICSVCFWLCTFSMWLKIFIKALCGHKHKYCLVHCCYYWPPLTQIVLMITKRLVCLSMYIGSSNCNVLHLYKCRIYPIPFQSWTNL